MKWAVVLFAVLLFALPVRADPLFPVPSTPDISVSTTATTEVVFTGSRGYVDWIYLKNDCPAGALYFDLRDVRDAAARRYPLRLSPSETFEASMRVYSVTASPDTANANTCTFTLMGAAQ